MARSAGRNNIIAGLFLLGGIVLAIVVSVVLSGAGDIFSRPSVYTVRFSLSEGASGIKAGSSVLLGGQEIGKVRSVSFQPAQGEPPGTLEIGVKMAVRGTFTFYPDALIYLERPLLGSLSTINIVSVGSPQSGPPLSSGDSIRGGLAPPSFLAQAGVGSEQIKQIQEIISSAHNSTTRLTGMLDRWEPRLDSILTSADDTAKTISQRIPAWSKDVDETLAGTKKVGDIADSAALGVKEARDVVRKADAILDDGAPKVASILSEAQSAAEKINRESIDRFNTALDHAESALDVIARTSSELAGLLREEAPGLRRIFANARLASEQLKLASVEIRSQPWRLLYTPTAKESETSVLYDAARSYATAASDVRAASESLEAAIGATSTQSGAPGAAQASDHESIERLRDELKRSTEKYREAEDALLNLLIKRGGESAPTEPKK